MSVYIPPSVRGPLYALFALVGLVLGAIQIAFSAAEAGRPVWLTVALAVYPFVGAGIGFTAASNTPSPPLVAADTPPEAQPEQPAPGALIDPDPAGNPGGGDTSAPSHSPNINAPSPWEAP